jgi:dienelactone hydrolase
MNRFKTFARIALPCRGATLRRRNALLIVVCAALLFAPARFSAPAKTAGETQALFDVGTPAGAPFPSDLFTVADASQNTGLRVNLPKADCSAHPSDCEDLDLINTLDGFNLQPRLSIPFDGPVDVTTVNSRTVFLVKLGDTLSESGSGGQVVGINQVVWDPPTNTLHVESDELLDQHTRYSLVVTNGLRDPEGRPVEASEAFRRFRHDLNFGQTHDRDQKDYRKALLDALKAARAAGVQESDVVTASVFTTQSAAAILEKIRDQIKAATPAPADFFLGPGGTRTVFTLNDVTGVRWNQQLRTDSTALSPVNVNLSWLRNTPGAVGRIAFGKYLSPEYETAERVIPQVGTRTGTPLVQGTNELFFNLYLPSGPEPAGGWPVVLFGHGSGSSKQGGPQGGASMAMAAALAEQGIATLAINAVGHGFGPRGTLTVDTTGGASVTFPAGGRGSDLDGDGAIGNLEGVRAIGPRAIIDTRDGFRQTAVDLMQLVRVIEGGVDVDGDGARDLDPSRIYCVGQSFGGNYCSDFLAVEPSVRAGVLLVTGGSFPDVSRLGPLSRPRIGGLLAARTPSLVNTPGVTHIEGVPINGIRFHENIPLRDGVPLRVRLADGTVQEIRSPVVNAAAGAMPIQELIERMEWVQQSGNGLTYAPYLRKAPLAGVPAKSVLYQFDRGDQTSPNPAETAYLRAGDLADRATFYRNDLAYAEDPTVPNDPHTFPTRIDSPNALVRAVARGSQQQIATFLASGGTLIIHPEPSRFFEVPIAGPLPEDLGFILP